MDSRHLNKYLQDTGSLNHDTLKELKTLTEEFPWFQAGWLIYLKNLKEVASPDFEKVLKKVALMVPERKNLFRFLNSELPKRQSNPTTDVEDASLLYQLEGDAENSDSNSLIDKFLKTDLSSGRINKNNLNSSECIDNQEVLEKSVAEDDEIITETLASIYFQQKNYEKARQAYHKLSLKYPEKSVYFAARIKEIEVLKEK